MHPQFGQKLWQVPACPESVAAVPEHVQSVCLSLCPSVPGAGSGAALAGIQAGGTGASPLPSGVPGLNCSTQL